MQTRMKWMLVVVAAVIAAACGDSMSSLNPTAPSALSPATLKVEANAADVPAGTMGNGPKPGNANGNGNGNGNGGAGNGNQQPTPPGRAKVEIEGLIDAVGGGSITVNSQKALVTAATVIRHGNRPVELLALRVKDRVHLRANRIEPTAAGVALEATEIHVQNPGDGDVALPPAPPAPTSQVSVSANDPDAGENGNPGVFRLARSGDASSSLTVSFSLTGSATDGVDYESLPTTVMFPGGLATVDVTLTPKTDSLVEGNESATLTVMAGAGYELGSPSSATVNIADHVVPAGPVVTVLATDPQATEDMSLFGIFELRRTGDLSQPLTVTVSFGGTASVDDYQDPGGVTVTFNAFEATATVVVIANQDFQAEGAETVILTVVDGDGYDPGAPATATVTIPANNM